MKKSPFTLLIHIALAVITAGAIVTHYCGIQGKVTLYDGGKPTYEFEKSSGPGEGKFPFGVKLEKAEVDFYPGTTTAMNYRSLLKAGDESVEVSMNHVGEIDNWRFYQSGMAADSSTLSVSYDPWGTGITYIGYLLLGIGMTGFFFQRKTLWKALMKQGGKAAVFVAVLMFCPLSGKSTTINGLPAMQAPLAANLGKAYVYWNERVCPIQTMAKDVCYKLYGTDSYKRMSAEQVLSGWLFYYETWLRDYHSQSASNQNDNTKSMAEKEALVRWLGTGEAFKIYPYHTASGDMEWLSLTGKRPSQMSMEQWKFMQRTMPRIQELLLEGNNIQANEVVSELIEGQRLYAGAAYLPSEARMNAERYYNQLARPGYAAAVILLLSLLYFYISLKYGGVSNKYLRLALTTALGAMSIYTLGLIGVKWWIGGHIPLSNGPETMMFMGLISLLGSLAQRRGLIRGSLLLVSAMAWFVAAMGGKTPQIGMLMPVLASPLLSIHVMLVMTSYSLFMLMAILSATALCIKDKSRQKELCRINRIILTPSVFLLAAGIFVGAVWANQSWGRYWGWDPKETCALAMMLIYSVPLHWSKIKQFRKPKFLHLYLLIAVISVAFTYFGANYLLPGLHSYA